jgi:hypothetical protein
MREDDLKERIAKIIDEARRKGRLPAHYYADEILSAIPRNESYKPNVIVALSENS